MTHMTHMTHCYNPTRMRAHARTRTRDRPSRCVICVMTPPAWVGGYPRTVGHRLVGPSSFRQIRGKRVLNVDTLLVSEYALRVPPVMGPRGGYRPRHRGVDPPKRTPTRAREVVYSWVDLVGTSIPSLWGGYSRGLVARICAAERQRTAEPPETASTLVRMTHLHTMQEPLPDPPTPVSALTQGGGREEMTTNGAAHGIVVGFAH